MIERLVKGQVCNVCSNIPLTLMQKACPVTCSVLECRKDRDLSEMTKQMLNSALLILTLYSRGHKKAANSARKVCDLASNFVYIRLLPKWTIVVQSSEKFLALGSRRESSLNHIFLDEGRTKDIIKQTYLRRYFFRCPLAIAALDLLVRLRVT